MKTPLAWLQLTREKVRLLVAIAGITFADILMFMQFGFRDALLSSSITFHQSIKGNIFLVGKQSTALIAMDRFPRQRLYQALAFGGVSAVHPIYIGLGMWKNPDPARQANRLFCKENFLIEPTKQGDKVLECPNTRQIMVIGFQPEYELFDLPAVNERREAMKLTDVLLFDQESRPEFGPIPQMYAKGEVIETELSNRRVQVGGLFTLGASFAADANVMTSDLNFMRIFPSRSLDEVDIGVIQLSAGADEAAILGAMRQYLPKDVWVFSRQEFFSWEQKYWK
ncbi:MAG: ABC transporter, partial [Microcoleaceae cyanobacterium]